MKLHAATLCVEEIGAAEIRKSLRTQRKALKLSQLALAKRAGVPASNINRIEEGKQEITPRTFARRHDPGARRPRPRLHRQQRLGPRRQRPEAQGFGR